MFSEGDIFRSILDLFLAGSETTAGTLHWCFMFMVKYPHVQEKCYHEIAEVSFLYLTCRVVKVIYLYCQFLIYLLWEFIYPAPEQQFTSFSFVFFFDNVLYDFNNIIRML